MQSPADVLKSGFNSLELSAIVRSSPTVLIGISDGAGQALRMIGINTVFDLGASSLFALAQRIVAAAGADSPSSRFGLVPSDWLHNGGAQASFEELADQPLASMRGLTVELAEALGSALGVATIRELAHWPPYLNARDIVSEAAGATASIDEVQTERLRPRFGEFPTERVYYTTLVMLQMQFEGTRDSIRGPISLKSALESTRYFTRPAIGALLTVSQSWYAQGITLGQMLHSLALAPGEATRIAVVDWSKRVRGRGSEEITEREDLDNALGHSRALSEVQGAVAREMQQGGSTSASSSTSESGSVQATVGTGLLSGLYVDAEVSGSYQSASTDTFASSTAWSQGDRSVIAGLTQNVNDRTEQHATAVRNRRATSFQEVSQAEHSEVSTRIVANYNHMHALTVQYYEVVQVYRVASQIHQAERCLFLPLEPIDFGAADAGEYVERFRGALVRGALTRRVRDLLIDDTTTVVVETVLPPPRPSPRAETPDSQRIPDAERKVEPKGDEKEDEKDKERGIDKEKADAEEVRRQLREKTRRRALSSAATRAAFGHVAAGAHIRDIASASAVLGRNIVRQGSDALHLTDDTLLVGLSFSGIEPQRLQLDRINRTAADSTLNVPPGGGRFDLPEAMQLDELRQLALAKAGQDRVSTTLTLHLVRRGRNFDLPVTVVLEAGTALQTVLRFSTDREDRRRELMAHLKANALHYSQAIFRALDAATIVALLSQFDWKGRPLADQVEPKPLMVTGNYLVLRAPIDMDAMSGVEDSFGRAMKWSELLERRGVDFKERNERLVPIPTQGVFAEAVLGRSNAAEKIDLTRFWNWQDSPIPLTPTEIQPPSTERRETPLDVRPGQLGPPVLNIMNPTTLPDPAGLGAVLGAVANGSMFSGVGMAGLAGTQAMAQAGAQGTLDAATQAARIAGENMRAHMQKSVAMGQIAADIAKTAITSGASSLLSEGSLSGLGGMINQAREMDARAAEDAVAAPEEAVADPAFDDGGAEPADEPPVTGLGSGALPPSPIVGPSTPAPSAGPLEPKPDSGGPADAAGPAGDLLPLPAPAPARPSRRSGAARPAANGAAAPDDADLPGKILPRKPKKRVGDMERSVLGVATHGADPDAVVRTMEAAKYDDGGGAAQRNAQGRRGSRAERLAADRDAARRRFDRLWAQINPSDPRERQVAAAIAAMPHLFRALRVYAQDSDPPASHIDDIAAVAEVLQTYPDIRLDYQSANNLNRMLTRGASLSAAREDWVNAARYLFFRGRVEYVWGLFTHARYSFALAAGHLIQSDGRLRSGAGITPATAGNLWENASTAAERANELNQAVSDMEQAVHYYALAGDTPDAQAANARLARLRAAAAGPPPSQPSEPSGGTPEPNLEAPAEPESEPPPGPTAPAPRARGWRPWG